MTDAFDTGALFEHDACRSRRELVSGLALAFAVFGRETRRLVGEAETDGGEGQRLLAAGLTGALTAELLMGVVALTDVRGHGKVPTDGQF